MLHVFDEKVNNKKPCFEHFYVYCCRELKIIGIIYYKWRILTSLVMEFDDMLTKEQNAVEINQ